jgi:hypothetical protein
MRSTLGLAAVVAIAALGGCATQRVSLVGGPREYVASDYPQVLKRWTRTESLVVLYDLDDKLTVTATFESYDFRWAYVVKYASDYRLTVEQRRELLAKALHDTEDTHEFYIALYGTNRRWTDLTKSTSAWRSSAAIFRTRACGGRCSACAFRARHRTADRRSPPTRAGSACGSRVPKATRSFAGISRRATRARRRSARRYMPAKISSSGGHVTSSSCAD